MLPSMKRGIDPEPYRRGLRRCGDLHRSDRRTRRGTHTAFGHLYGWTVANSAEGCVDVLVANAGVYEPAPLDTHVWDDVWGRTLAVNPRAPAVLCRLAVLHARARLDAGETGTAVRIVTISSRAAFRGDDEAHWTYAASKAGLVAGASPRLPSRDQVPGRAHRQSIRAGEPCPSGGVDRLLRMCGDFHGVDGSVECCDEYGDVVGVNARR